MVDKEGAMSEIDSIEDTKLDYNFATEEEQLEQGFFTITDDSTNSSEDHGGFEEAQITQSITPPGDSGEAKEGFGNQIMKNLSHRSKAQFLSSRGIIRRRSTSFETLRYFDFEEHEKRVIRRRYSLGSYGTKMTFMDGIGSSLHGSYIEMPQSSPQQNKENKDLTPESSSKEFTISCGLGSKSPAETNCDASNDSDERKQYALDTADDHEWQSVAKSGAEDNLQIDENQTDTKTIPASAHDSSIDADFLSVDGSFADFLSTESNSQQGETNEDESETEPKSQLAFDSAYNDHQLSNAEPITNQANLGESTSQLASLDYSSTQPIYTIGSHEEDDEILHSDFGTQESQQILSSQSEPWALSEDTPRRSNRQTFSMDYQASAIFESIESLPMGAENESSAVQESEEELDHHVSDAENELIGLLGDTTVDTFDTAQMEDNSITTHSDGDSYRNGEVREITSLHSSIEDAQVNNELALNADHSVDCFEKFESLDENFDESVHEIDTQSLPEKSEQALIKPDQIQDKSSLKEEENVSVKTEDPEPHHESMTEAILSKTTSDHEVIDDFSSDSKADQLAIDPGKKEVIEIGPTEGDVVLKATSSTIEPIDKQENEVTKDTTIDATTCDNFINNHGSISSLSGKIEEDFTQTPKKSTESSSESSDEVESAENDLVALLGSTAEAFDVDRSPLESSSLQQRFLEEDLEADQGHSNTLEPAAKDSNVIDDLVADNENPDANNSKRGNNHVLEHEVDPKSTDRKSVGAEEVVQSKEYPANFVLGEETRSDTAETVNDVGEGPKSKENIENVENAILNVTYELKVSGQQLPKEEETNSGKKESPKPSCLSQEARNEKHESEVNDIVALLGVTAEVFDVTLSPFGSPIQTRSAEDNSGDYHNDIIPPNILVKKSPSLSSPTNTEGENSKGVNLAGINANLCDQNASNKSTTDIEKIPRNASELKLEGLGNIEKLPRNASERELEGLGNDVFSEVNECDEKIVPEETENSKIKGVTENSASKKETENSTSMGDFMNKENNEKTLEGVKEEEDPEQELLALLGVPASSFSNHEDSEDGSTSSTSPSQTHQTPENLEMSGLSSSDYNHTVHTTNEGKPEAVGFSRSLNEKDAVTMESSHDTKEEAISIDSQNDNEQNDRNTCIDKNIDAEENDLVDAEKELLALLKNSDSIPTIHGPNDEGQSSTSVVEFSESEKLVFDVSDGQPQEKMPQSEVAAEQGDPDNAFQQRVELEAQIFSKETQSESADLASQSDFFIGKPILTPESNIEDPGALSEIIEPGAASLSPEERIDSEPPTKSQEQQIPPQPVKSNTTVKPESKLAVQPSKLQEKTAEDLMGSLETATELGVAPDPFSERTDSEPHPISRNEETPSNLSKLDSQTDYSFAGKPLLTGDLDKEEEADIQHFSGEGEVKNKLPQNTEKEDERANEYPSAKEVQVELPPILEEKSKRSDVVSLSSAASTISHGSTTRGLSLSSYGEDSMIRRSNTADSKPPLFPKRGGKELQENSKSFFDSVSKKASFHDSLTDKSEEAEERPESRWIKQSKTKSFDPKNSIFAARRKKTTTDDLSLSPPGSPPEPYYPGIDADEDSSSEESQLITYEKARSLLAQREASSWDMLTLPDFASKSSEGPAPAFVVMPDLGTLQPTSFYADDWGADSITTEATDAGKSLSHNAVDHRSSIRSDVSQSSMSGRRRGMLRTLSGSSPGGNRRSSSRGRRRPTMQMKENSLLEITLIHSNGLPTQFPLVRDDESEIISVGVQSSASDLHHRRKSGNLFSHLLKTRSTPNLRSYMEDSNSMNLSNNKDKESEVFHPTDLTKEQPAKEETRNKTPLRRVSAPAVVLKSKHLAFDSPVLLFHRIDSDGKGSPVPVPIHGVTTLEEELMAFSSMRRLEIPFRYKKAIDSFGYLGSIRWRQLVANWKHSEMIRAMRMRRTSYHFLGNNDANSLQEIAEERSLSSSTIGLGTNAKYDRLELNGVVMGGDRVRPDTKSLGGFNPQHRDLAIPSITRFLAAIGHCEGSDRMRNLFHEGYAAKHATIDSLRERAKSHLSEFSNLVEEVAAFGAMNLSSESELDKQSLSFSVSVKHRESIEKKAVQKYGGDLLQVKDILRAKIIFPDEGCLVCGLFRLQELSVDGGVEDLNEQKEKTVSANRTAFTISRIKNLLASDSFFGDLPPPLPTGYRHVLLNVRLESGLLAEIQLNLSSLFGILGEEGYRLHREITDLQHICDTEDFAEKTYPFAMEDVIKETLNSREIYANDAKLFTNLSLTPMEVSGKVSPDSAFSFGTEKNGGENRIDSIPSKRYVEGKEIFQQNFPVTVERTFENTITGDKQNGDQEKTQHHDDGVIKIAESNMHVAQDRNSQVSELEALHEEANPPILKESFNEQKPSYAEEISKNHKQEEEAIVGFDESAERKMLKNEVGQQLETNGEIAGQTNVETIATNVESSDAGDSFNKMNVHVIDAKSAGGGQQQEEANTEIGEEIEVQSIGDDGISSCANEKKVPVGEEKSTGSGETDTKVESKADDEACANEKNVPEEDGNVDSVQQQQKTDTKVDIEIITEKCIDSGEQQRETNTKGDAETKDELNANAEDFATKKAAPEKEEIVDIGQQQQLKTYTIVDVETTGETSAEASVSTDVAENCSNKKEVCDEEEKSEDAGQHEPETDTKVDVETFVESNAEVSVSSKASETYANKTYDSELEKKSEEICQQQQETDLKVGLENMAQTTAEIFVLSEVTKDCSNNKKVNEGDQIEVIGQQQQERNTEIDGETSVAAGNCSNEKKVSEGEDHCEDIGQIEQETYSQFDAKTTTVEYIADLSVLSASAKNSSNEKKAPEGEEKCEDIGQQRQAADSKFDVKTIVESNSHVFLPSEAAEDYSREDMVPEGEERSEEQQHGTDTKVGVETSGEASVSSAAAANCSNERKISEGDEKAEDIGQQQQETDTKVDVESHAAFFVSSEAAEYCSSEKTFREGEVKSGDVSQFKQESVSKLGVETVLETNTDVSVSPEAAKIFTKEEKVPEGGEKCEDIDQQLKETVTKIDVETITETRPEVSVLAEVSENCSEEKVLEGEEESEGIGQKQQATESKLDIETSVELSVSSHAAENCSNENKVIEREGKSGDIAQHQQKANTQVYAESNADIFVSPKAAKKSSHEKTLVQGEKKFEETGQQKQETDGNLGVGTIFETNSDVYMSSDAAEIFSHENDVFGGEEKSKYIGQQQRETDVEVSVEISVKTNVTSADCAHTGAHGVKEKNIENAKGSNKKQQEANTEIFDVETNVTSNFVAANDCVNEVNGVAGEGKCMDRSEQEQQTEVDVVINAAASSNSAEGCAAEMNVPAGERRIVPEGNQTPEIVGQQHTDANVDGTATGDADADYSVSSLVAENCSNETVHGEDEKCKDIRQEEQESGIKVAVEINGEWSPPDTKDTKKVPEGGKIEQSEDQISVGEVTPDDIEDSRLLLSEPGREELKMVVKSKPVKESDNLEIRKGNFEQSNAGLPDSECCQDADRLKHLDAIKSRLSELSGGDIFLLILENASIAASKSSRDVATFYCLYALLTYIMKMETESDIHKLGFGVKSYSDILRYSQRCLLRCLKISNQAISTGMTGWLEYGSSSALDRLTQRPFLILRKIAYDNVSLFLWDDAECILAALVMQCEQNLPLYHPTTLTSLLDLAIVSSKLENGDYASRIVMRVAERLSSYLSEMENDYLAHLSDCRSGRKQGNKSFRVEEERDALFMLQSFTSLLQSQLDRDIVTTVGRDNEIVLVQHCFLGDSLSVLANCVAAARSLLGTASQNASDYGTKIWRLAYAHYQRAFKGSSETLGLGHPSVARAAYGIARCMREFGETEKALQLLSVVVSASESQRKSSDELKPSKRLSYRGTKEPPSSPGTKKFIPRSLLLSSSSITNIGRTNQLMSSALCLWLMAILSMDASPNEYGRDRSFSYLHAASVSLQDALESLTESDCGDSLKSTIIGFLGMIEDEAMQISEHLDE